VWLSNPANDFGGKLMEEWVTSYDKPMEHQKALRMSLFLTGKFPYKSQYEWYCVLTQIKYIEELME